MVDNFIILETVIFSRQLEKTSLWYKVRTSKLFEPKLALCMYGGTQIVTLPAVSGHNQPTSKWSDTSGPLLYDYIKTYTMCSHLKQPSKGEHFKKGFCCRYSLVAFQGETRIVSGYIQARLCKFKDFSRTSKRLSYCFQGMKT